MSQAIERKSVRVSRRGRRLITTLKQFRILAPAVAIAAVSTVKAQTSATISAGVTDNGQIGTTGAKAGTNGKVFIDLENDANASFASFGVLDFGSLNVGNNVINSVNSLELDMVDAPASFSSTSAITVDFYLTTDTTTSIQPGTTPLKYFNGVTPQGVSGTQLAGANGLTFLGAGSYSKTTLGTPFIYSLTNTAAAFGTQTIAQYLASELNTGGTVRIVATIDTGTRTPAAAATFTGVGNNSGAPVLKFGVTETALPSNDSVLYLGSPGNTSASINLGRVIKGSLSSTQNFLVGNTGTSTAKIIYDTSGGGTGSIAPTPASLGGGATGTLSAGLTASFTNATPGTDVNGVLNVINQANTNAANIQVNIGAHVVANRLIQNTEFDSGTNATSFGKILVGRSVTNTITVDTQNPNQGIPDDPNYLVNVNLGAGGTASFANTSYMITGTNIGGAVSFSNAGSTAQFLVAVSPIKSGSVGLGTNAAFLRWSGTSAGTFITGEGLAGESDFINNYAQFTGYAPALLTGTTTGSTGTSGTFSLNNAAANDNGTNSLRLGATVTNQSVTAQQGFTISSLSGQNVAVPTGTSTGTTLGGNWSFNKSGMLNGTYRATVGLTAQNFDNGLGVQGLSSNDLGTTNVTISSAVTGNVGNGTANLLSGGSYAGYNISSNSSVNSTVSFLAGTAQANTVIGVTFNGVSTNAAVLSDKATVSGTGTDKYVVQYSFSTLGLTGTNAGSVALGYFNGTNYVGAFKNTSNSGSTATEAKGAYDNNLTLGHYGVDTVNKTVWAVVDKSGQFAAVQRLGGDADFSGTTDFNDFLTFQNNFNHGGTVYSTGDFDGSGTTDFNDFLVLQNNYNHSLAGGAVKAGLAHPGVSKLTASPAVAAPTVTYVLSKNDDGHGNFAAGKYAVYAIDSTADGNKGVASFSVDVLGFTLVTNFAPKGTYDKGLNNGSTVNEGFTPLRSSNGSPGSGTDPVKGSQDTVDDQSGVVLIYGMGQTAGNLNSSAPAGSSGGSNKTQPAYTAPLVIATGNFSDPNALGFNSDQTFDKANVFLTNTAGDTEASGIVLQTQVLTGVPEPTTLGLIALGAGAMLGRRRRKQ